MNNELGIMSPKRRELGVNNILRLTGNRRAEHEKEYGHTEEAQASQLWYVQKAK